MRDADLQRFTEESTVVLRHLTDRYLTGSLSKVPGTSLWHLEIPEVPGTTHVTQHWYFEAEDVVSVMVHE